MNKTAVNARPAECPKLSELRRQSIKITENNDPLDEFREMIRAYSAAAHALNRKKQELLDELKTETDVERRKDLELRKNTLEAERYEVLDDMRSLIGYVAEREK